MDAEYPVDKNGFLCNLEDWTPLVAQQLAHAEGIELTDAHWQVIDLLRQYYEEYDSSPAMRALVKYIRIRLDPEQGKSSYLLSLFPGSPAKIGSKIAGLPKPDNCL